MATQITNIKTKEEIINDLYEEGDYCYGVGEVIMKKYEINFWFKYLVEFDKNGEQIAVYIENKNETKLCEKKRLLLRIINGDECLVLVADNYDLKEYPNDYDVEETWICNY